MLQKLSFHHTIISQQTDGKPWIHHGQKIRIDSWITVVHFPLRKPNSPRYCLNLLLIVYVLLDRQVQSPQKIINNLECISQSMHKCTLPDGIHSYSQTCRGDDIWWFGQRYLACWSYRWTLCWVFVYYFANWFYSQLLPSIEVQLIWHHLWLIEGKEFFFLWAV